MADHVRNGKMGASVKNGNTSSLDEAVSPVINSTRGKTLRNHNCSGNDSTQDKGKSEKETPSDGKRNKSLAFETRNVQTTELPIAQGSGNEMTCSASNGCTLRLETDPTNAEEEIAGKESEKVENEGKILELQRLNEEAEKDIAQRQSFATTIGQQLEHAELQSQTTASASW